ncbi:MAG: FABP family protein [Acidimicrobiales bacterium]|nr:FABP family protein [Acidimicrobiales bacterium]
MTEPSLHPLCEPLAGLVGTWVGEGSGSYPTIEPFRYREEVRFWHVGKPFLAYAQRTWDPDTGAPLHAEAGYWRPVAPGRVELVIAHPTGVTELAEGTVAAGRIDVETTAVGLSGTAKEVRAVARTVDVDGDDLRYTLRMAAVGVPLTHHLAAELHRTA